MKRVFEFILALIILVIVSPVMFTVAIILCFTGERRVFFKQQRIGRHNEPFDLRKFTTMMDTALTRPGAGITLDDDPDVFPFGRFLRRTKINELPQLINILIGHMSIVGPRPLTEKTFSKYPVAVQEILGSVRPGVTGIGSIVFRDEQGIIARSGMEREKVYNEFILPHKADLEKWYVENASLYLDLKIILATIVVVLLNRDSIVKRLLSEIPQLVISNERD